MDLPREYVRLGLSFDRLERGFVDAWTGPAAVRCDIESGPVPEPRDLVRRARELRAELGSTDLSPERQAFLDAQLGGLEVSGRVLAGERLPYLAQVQAYFQVRPEIGDPSVYETAHRDLDALLPGPGPLLERYTAYREAASVPPGRLTDAVRAWSTLLRARTRAAFPLPDREDVHYEIVRDRPWAGFNYYRGGFRSTVAINADLPVGLGALPGLIAHESYPGHHTERCRKQARLRDLPELDVWLVNTPENLLAEGLADLGLQGVGLQDWAGVAVDLYADLGIAYDGERGLRIAAAAAALGRVRQDTAILLHDRRAGVDEAQEHLTRWALLSPARARKALAFLTHPLWRAYITTYVEGERLLSGWLMARPAACSFGERFARLLDEQLTPRRLQSELA